MDSYSVHDVPGVVQHGHLREEVCDMDHEHDGGPGYLPEHELLLHTVVKDDLWCPHCGEGKWHRLNAFIL